MEGSANCNRMNDLPTWESIISFLLSWASVNMWINKIWPFWASTQFTISYSVSFDHYVAITATAQSNKELQTFLFLLAYPSRVENVAVEVFAFLVAFSRAFKGFLLNPVRENWIFLIFLQLMLRFHKFLKFLTKDLILELLNQMLKVCVLLQNDPEYLWYLRLLPTVIQSCAMENRCVRIEWSQIQRRSYC